MGVALVIGDPRLRGLRRYLCADLIGARVVSAFLGQSDQREGRGNVAWLVGKDQLELLARGAFTASTSPLSSRSS